MRLKALGQKQCSDTASSSAEKSQDGRGSGLKNILKPNWGLVIALAFYVLFVTVTWFVHDRPWSLEEDGFVFLIGARSAPTDHYASTRSPGWSFLVWLLSRTGLDLFQAGKLLVALSGLLFLSVTFFLLNLSLNRALANWGVLLVAGSYNVLAWSVLLGSHMTAAAFALLGLCLFLDRRNRLVLAASAICLGFAATVRINYLSLLGIGVWLFFDRIKLRQKLFNTVFWAGMMLLSASPFLFVNWSFRGSALDTGQWRLAATALLGRDPSQYASVGDFLSSDPITIAAKWMLRFLLDLPSYIPNVFAWIGILGIPGLVVGTLAEPCDTMSGNLNRPLREVSTALVLFTTPLAFVYFNSAYLLFAIPLLVAGVLALTDRVGKSARKEVFYVTLVFVLLLTLLDMTRSARYSYQQALQTPEYASAGGFLRTEAHRGDNILVAGQIFLKYYSEGPNYVDCRTLSPNTPRTDLDYIIIDSRYSDLAATCLETLGEHLVGFREVYHTDREPVLRVYKK